MTATDIRAEFHRIKTRYLGVNDAIAPIRVSTLTAVEAHISQLELAAQTTHVCSVCQAQPVFDLTAHLNAPSRRNPLAAAFAAQIARAS
jgi:hypothetical protein